MKTFPKFRKFHKPHLLKNRTVHLDLLHPDSIGLKSLETTCISFGQLEAARRTIIRNLNKKKAKLFIRVFPRFPMTKFPQEVRMGGGKGSVDQ